ncbi:MAG: hypothetical protein ACKVIS_25525 [Pseudomonadales bacterium]
MATHAKPRISFFTGLPPLALEKVYLPHRFAVVLGVRVVDFVHSDGFGVMVDGDINRAAQGHFDAGGRATAAGEVIDH